MRMVYSKILVEHFEQPRHVGRLDEEAAEVGTGIAGTKETGGVIRVQIQIGHDNEITTARFKAYGPPALIAAGSWLTDTLVGSRLDAAAAFTHQSVAGALELPAAQLHCALLAEEAVHAAVRNYKDKQGVQV